QPEVTVNDISILEQTTGIRYNAGTGTGVPYSPVQSVPRLSQRLSASYVTGSHAVKAGFQLEEIYLRLGTEVGVNNVDYVFRNGSPVSINQWATPYEQSAQNKDFGFFAQDQWTMNRLSLTYGLRYEIYSGYIPPQNLAATPNGWVPARSFGEVTDVPLWKDFDPRVGAAYDLRGDGRTAVKVALGRYVSKASIGTITQQNNPINASINTVN